MHVNVGILYSFTCLGQVKVAASLTTCGNRHVGRFVDCIWSQFAPLTSSLAGFYPVTVSYLSLFYTRYEFARRLGIFYGQYAIAGAMGGLLAYGVFSKFPNQSEGSDQPVGGWKAWQILFLLEGCSTIVLALIGFFWLPHSAKTAWFFSPAERAWAEERIKRDMDGATVQQTAKGDVTAEQRAEDEMQPSASEESHGLLGSSSTRAAKADVTTVMTDDRGLTHADIASAVLNWKLWYLLVINILSSMPVTAFSVFLPLVLQKLTSSPEKANLLTAPPFLVGAVVLYTFTTWSDKKRQRLVPILWGLGLLLIGLTGVVALPMNWLLAKYFFLCVLMGGTFVPSPLTVAWIAGNTPEPGKRSVMLGVNGWGKVSTLKLCKTYANKLHQVTSPVSSQQCYSTLHSHPHTTLPSLSPLPSL
jgi:hypothetical protein